MFEQRSCFPSKMCEQNTALYTFFLAKVLLCTQNVETSLGLNPKCLNKSLCVKSKMFDQSLALKLEMCEESNQTCCIKSKLLK